MLFNYLITKNRMRIKLQMEGGGILQLDNYPKSKAKQLESVHLQNEQRLFKQYGGAKADTSRPIGKK